MKELNNTIRRIRKDNRISQKLIAERLHMARSTYSKIENGSTELNYKVLVSIARVLNVPIREIIGENGDPVFDGIKDDIGMMLCETEYRLINKLVKTVPFDELSKEHIAFLKERNCYDREYYESPSETDGRIFSFSPEDVFRFMINSCGMSVLFRRGLVDHPYFLIRWERRNKKLPDIQFDDRDYFVVLIGQLIMPEGKEFGFQVAHDDFPDEMDEEDILKEAIRQLGAFSGQYLCLSFEGYCPYTDILRINSGNYSIEEKILAT